MYALTISMVFFSFISTIAYAQESKPNLHKTAAYLDGQQEDWFAWSGSKIGTETSCISCHTNLTYALARPVIRRSLERKEFSKAENQMLANVKKRVDDWAINKLFYDSKPKQSQGTEAVLNALILATYDAEAGLGSITKPTKKAFKILWGLQSNGTWSWLEFGPRYEPFETPSAQYFGTALAAIAVGRAPGGYSKTTEIQANLKDLTKYLKSNFATQTLHNRLYALWADRALGGGILSNTQRTSLIEAVLSKQQPDGGFVLFSLGEVPASSGTGDVKWLFNSKLSDGYATGLIVYVLKKANVAKTDSRIRQALHWLQVKQNDGVWVGYSVIKKRDPNTRSGKFMTNAATAFAVLGLTAYDQ